MSGPKNLGRSPTVKKTAPLGGVLSSGEVGKAIGQARDYCRAKSIQFAVVTNGSAWIVFPAVRIDEVTFERTQARVFTSLADVSLRFVEFWELLSRQRVTEGNLESELLARERNASDGRRLIAVLKEPGFRLGRNALYEHIEPAVNTALNDEALLSDPEALRLCYVKSSERQKYDSRLQMYLSDIKPPLGHKTVRVKGRKGETHFETRLSDTPASQTRFILLLGPVGAGKTTFLEYTAQVSAADRIRGRILWLYVNFKKATKNDNAKTFIYNQLLQLIDEDEEFGLGDWGKSVKPAYASLIQNLERGPLFLLKQNSPEDFDKEVSQMIMKERQDVQPYVERILQSALRSHPGFLIIDNVDQIDSDDLQNEIFGEAQAAARRIGLNVVMSLRDATYLRHRNSPVFDAFQFESLYIDPPSIAPVLSRRFAYAKSGIL